jgi:hypothetical protein
MISIVISIYSTGLAAAAAVAALAAAGFLDDWGLSSSGKEGIMEEGERYIAATSKNHHWFNSDRIDEIVKQHPEGYPLAPRGGFRQLLVGS